MGIDSFIFVDDNPKETAEVCESVPEVTALTLPIDFERVWAFDHVRVTEEDRKRNASVAGAREFGLQRKQAAGLKQFLDTLELRLDVRRGDGGELASCCAVDAADESVQLYGHSENGRGADALGVGVSDGRCERTVLGITG